MPLPPNHSDSFLVLPGRDGRQSSLLVIVKSHSCTLAHAAVSRTAPVVRQLLDGSHENLPSLPVFLARLSLLPSSFLHDAAQFGGRIISSCSSPDFDKVEIRNA